MLGASPERLPNFPEHYNEDYVWLHALGRHGWQLDRTDSRLAHAPAGEIHITAPALSFQVFGEIVWLAVLERERFPADRPEGLAAAIAEISGDMVAALASDAVRGRPEVASAVESVLSHYREAASAAADGRNHATVDALLRAVANGLKLHPS